MSRGARSACTQEAHHDSGSGTVQPDAQIFGIFRVAWRITVAIVTLAIGVLVQPPIPGVCKPRLLAAHSAEWVAGLYAAMLRDTLDGLQLVDAEHYVVLVAAEDDARETAHDALARHVPAPWEIAFLEGNDRATRAESALAQLFARGASYALLCAGDAPSAPTEPLLAALEGARARGAILIGPSEDGGELVLGMPKLLPRLVHDIPWGTPAVVDTTRLRSRELALPYEELPASYDVDEPSDVMRLIEELRKHPERAPRTAHYLVTKA